MNKNETTAHTCRYICELHLSLIRYAYIYTTGRTAFKLAPSYIEFSRFTVGTKLLAFLYVLPPVCKSRHAATLRVTLQIHDKKSEPPSDSENIFGEKGKTKVLRYMPY
jgi:hypothetical protein